MRPEHYDAVVCYILSKRQGVAMIATIMEKSEDEVRRLIAEGERIVQQRGESRPKP